MTAALNEPTAPAADPESRSSRVGRLIVRWRSIPVLVRAATGGLAGLMLAMMYLYPVNYGFDEPQHFDMVYAYAQGHGPYAPGQRALAIGVIMEQGISAPSYPPSTRFTDRGIRPRSQRPSIDALGGDSKTTGQPNQMVQHPPLYYLLGAAVLDFPGVSSLSYDIQFTLLRLLSLLLLLPLPWLCYATARRLGAGDLSLAAALVPLLLPALARTGATVTNDSLMTLATGVAVYLITKVVTGDSTLRTAGWLGAWVLIALLTKGFALALPLIAVLAYVLCWRRYGASVLRQLGIVVAASAIGGIWWLHNLIAYGTVQPDGFGPGFLYRHYLQIHPGPKRGQFGDFLGVLFQRLSGRFWGSIGLIESPDYNWTFVWPATAILLGLVLLTLVRGLPGRFGRTSLAVPLLILPLIIVLMASEAWHQYHRFVLLPNVQGRYLFPAVPILAGTAMLGLSRVVRGRARRFVAPALLLAAVIAQAWTVRAVMHAWWITVRPVSQLKAWGGALHMMVNWAPWPIGITVVIGLIIFTVFARLLFVTATALREPVAEPVAERPAARVAT